MPEPRMREPREPREITIPIIVNDGPRLPPHRLEVTVKGPLLAGPIGERMAVFDYNLNRDLVFPPATPRKDGTFPDYDLDDMRFHQLNTYAIAARATELVEYELGRPLRWGFEGSRLLVVPHAGTLDNAFYSAESHSLQFYSFMGEGKRVFHTALAHDIVAHETGHAILDAVRPRYYEPFEPETSALHEAIGDLCAIFAGLSHDVVQRKVAGSLHRLNLLSEIAEGFEEAGAEGWGSLRSLVTATPSDWKDTIEPHDLSLKLSSTLYFALRKVHETLVRRGETKLSALSKARSVIQRMAVRALDFLPPADCTLSEYAEAMLAADRAIHPVDTDGFRAIVHRVLAKRGLVSERETPIDDSRWSDYPSSWPQPSERDAYLFLNANRDRLALKPHADQRDFIIRGVQQKRVPSSKGEVLQIAIVYEYPVDVKLGPQEAEAFGEEWITLRGGGTLVFDQLGRLLYDCQKPVTRDRVNAAKRFLSDEADEFTVVGVSLDDDIRRAAARRPWIAEANGRRLTLRSNFAACCGRSKRRAR